MPAPDARAGATAPPALDPGHLLTALAAAQWAFATLLAEADPDAPVAACAPWTVTDLALHLGGVHRWAAGMARGVDSGDGADADPAVPREPAALLASYREQADLLLATLVQLDPDAPALTLDGPGPASFWRRRQVHETLVHLQDLADAAGVPHPLDVPGLWADGVDEVVTVMAPRQVRLGRIAPPEHPVALVAADAGASWVLGDRPGTTPRATVTGPARTLALLLWRRTGADDPALAVAGDRAALDATLGRALTP